MTLTTVTGRPATRDEYSPTDFSIFETDGTHYPSGIRADLYDAVMRQEGRHEVVAYVPLSGRRYFRPVRPYIRRQAHAELGRLGLIPA